MTVIRARIPRGAGKKNPRVNLDTWYQAAAGGHGSCIVKIKNKDHLCAARAIVTGLAYVQGKEQEYQTLQRGDTNRNTAQRRGALELMRRAGIPEAQNGCDFRDLQKMGDCLPPGMVIRVFSADNFNELVFETIPVQGLLNENDGRKYINLFLHHGHYDLIRAMPAFFGMAYFCEHCVRGYTNKENHRCPDTCNCCFVKGANCNGQPIKCIDCSRLFSGIHCLNSHRTIPARPGGLSICQKVKKCLGCGKQTRTRQQRRKHRCHIQKCRICKAECDMRTHRCYIQRLEKLRNVVNMIDDEDRIWEEIFGNGLEETEEEEEAGLEMDAAESKTPSFIFFDFETEQSTEVSPDTFQHRVNMVVAQKVCDVCRHRVFRPLDKCEGCGNGMTLEQFWDGEEALDGFCRWLFSAGNKGCVALAHNASGYDAQFILDYLQRNAIKPKIIPKGRQIMKLEAGGVKILDSLNFLPMKLAALPGAYGETELKKGYFPHFFNSPENQEYVGPYPPPEAYGAENMTEKDRAAFLHWHREQEGKEFHFKTELLNYCRSDVDILRRCCLKFRDLFISQGDVDPFLQAATIAGACMKVFRTKHLKKDTIGIVPPWGYNPREKQSGLALKWLSWMAHKEGKAIRHARNGGEHKVGAYKLDGYCEETNEAFEFHGSAFFFLFFLLF